MNKVYYKSKDFFDTQHSFLIHQGKEITGKPQGKQLWSIRSGTFFIYIICRIDMKLNKFWLSYYRFIMLFIAFQVIIFTIIVDESLGCFNCSPSGRSLTEREVKFVKHRDFQYCFWCLLFPSYYYSFSLVTWIRYIGHLECAPKMKRLVWRKDMMEAT